MLTDLLIKISADVTDFHEEMKKIAKEMDELSSIFTNMGTTMTTSVTLPMLAAGAASVKLASDMQESLNKVNVAFGSSAYDVINWSKTSVEQMGLASGSALDAASLFGDMATSMGISQDQAAKMSMRLTQLGADLASFKNIPIEQAMQALNGVFTGETESLKTLGVVMTQTQLQTFALTQGITKKIDKMTEAEQVSLRYAFVLDRTKNAQGDFARTSEGTANQTRMFTENLKQLGQQFGDVILPYFNKMIQSANDLLKKFSGLDEDTKKWAVAIGVVAAAIGPLLLGIGSLILVAKDLAIAIRLVGSALTFLAANPIGVVLAAVGLFIIGITTLVMNWDKFSKFVNESSLSMKILSYYLLPIPTTIALITKNYDEFVARLKYGVEWMRETITQVSVLIQKFNLINQALAYAKGESQQYNEQLEKMAKNASLNKSLAETELQTKLNAISMENLRKKQLEVAGTTEFISNRYVQMGEAAKQYTPKQDDMNKKFDEGKNKADELANKLKSLQEVGVKAANDFADAVKTALKNRMVAEQDNFDSLTKKLDKEKAAYKDLLDTYKKNNEDAKKIFKDSSDKIIEEIDRRYKEIQDKSTKQADEESKPYQDKIDMIQRAFQEEQNAINDTIFEKQKESAIKSLLENQSAENRLKVTDELARVMIQREADLLQEGKTLRIDEMWQLTKEENDIIKKKVNDARKIEIDMLKLKINQINQAEAMQAVANEIRRQNEIAKEKERYEQDVKNYESAQERLLSMRETTYLKSIEYLETEIRESELRLNKYKESLNASNEQIIKDMTANQDGLVELLKKYNPSWKQAGIDFGNELIAGLQEKTKGIQEAVTKALNMIKSISGKVSAPTPNTSAPSLNKDPMNLRISAEVPSNGDKQVNVWLDRVLLTNQLASTMVDRNYLKNGYG